MAYLRASVVLINGPLKISQNDWPTSVGRLLVHLHMTHDSRFTFNLIRVQYQMLFHRLIARVKEWYLL